MTSLWAQCRCGLFSARLAARVAAEMTVFEDFVLEQVQAGTSTFGLYPPPDPETQESFKAWRSKTNT